MHKNNFCTEISEILEIKISEKQLEEIKIGQDVDSLALLEIISFFEEKFSITLDHEEIEGKSLNDLYGLTK